MKNHMTLTLNASISLMTRNFLLFILLLTFSSSILQAQEEYTYPYEVYINYDPSKSGENGYKLRITVAGVFKHFMGDPVYQHMAKIERVGTKIYLNGKWYNESEFDQSDLQDIGEGMVDYAFDIYDGSYKVTTYEKMSAIPWDMNASCSWGELFNGVSAENAKNLYRKGFQMKNFQVTNTDQLQYGFGAILNKLEEAEQDREDYNRSIEKATAAEQTGDINQAIEHYEAGLKIFPDNREIQSKIERLKNKKSEVNESIEKGNQQFNEGNWEGAKYYYNNALTLDTENSTAKNRLAEIEEKLSQAKQNREEYNSLLKKASTAEQAGNIDQAINYYEASLEIYPDKKDVKDRIESLKNRKSKVNESINDGDRHFNDGNWAAAKDSYNNALTLDPDNTTIKKRLVEVEKKQEEERKQAWESKKEKKQSERDRLAQQNAEYDAVIMTAATGLMLVNIGKDKPANKHRYGRFHTSIEFGFIYQNLPVVETNYTETYSTSSHGIDNADFGTLGLTLELELWPLYTKYIGIGARGSIYSDFLTSDDTEALRYTYGAEAYLGVPAFKIIGTFEKGAQNGYGSSQFYSDGYDNTSISEHDFYFSEYGLGICISFNAWNNRASLYGLYKVRNIEDDYTFSSIGLTGDYKIENGVEVGLDFANRINMSVTAYWQHNRVGQFDYDPNIHSSFDATLHGKYVELSLTRVLDYY